MPGDNAATLPSRCPQNLQQVAHRLRAPVDKEITLRTRPHRYPQDLSTPGGIDIHGWGQTLWASCGDLWTTVDRCRAYKKAPGHRTWTGADVNRVQEFCLIRLVSSAIWL